MPTQGLRQAQTDRARVILSLSKYVRWLLNLMTLNETTSAGSG